MEILDFIFRLGVVFAIYGFLWGIFEIGIRLLMAGRQRSIGEVYLFKGIKYFFLVNVTFLFCIHESEADLFVLHQLIIAGIILLTYFLGKLQNSQNRMVMFQMMGRGLPNVPNAQFSLRGEIIVIVGSLLLFLGLYFYPEWASNTASKWFVDSIKNIDDTPVFGFVFKVIGFFFVVSIIARMINAFNFLLSGGKVKRSTRNNSDDDDFTDYEEIN